MSNKSNLVTDADLRVAVMRYAIAENEVGETGTLPARVRAQQALHVLRGLGNRLLEEKLAVKG